MCINRSCDLTWGRNSDCILFNLTCTDIIHIYITRVIHRQVLYRPFCLGRAYYKWSAPALQVRIDGRFDSRGTIARSGTQRAIEVANLFTRRSREAQIRLARATGNQNQLAAARALPTRLDRRTADNLALSRERLMEQGSDAPSDRTDMRNRNLTGGELGYLEDEYYDMMYDNWEDWRDAYEEMSGYGSGGVQ